VGNTAANSLKYEILYGYTQRLLPIDHNKHVIANVENTGRFREIALPTLPIQIKKKGNAGMIYRECTEKPV
jgi:hypothetical protein